MMEEIDRFVALAPSGARLTIIKWQHFTEFQPLKGPRQRRPGTHEYRTDAGAHVNQRSERTFATLDSDETFTRI